ncbi:hypothetical protein MU1_00160 [Paenibacillus glycanilyticus]|uniref:RNA-directed DNA polymerase n=1 Tax=Paenibacillus glycanilyticus TaxID=126569 RepID=A0ABQ6G7I8_9BACL|nr:hypothetical protein MU1_00160 [Paenibacillus glycanilyticus]
MIEEVLSRANMLTALARVEANKGSHGVDGMSVKTLREHIVQNWPTIRESIRNGTYEPSPVRRVEIPKPNGGTRSLGIPTVTDRLIQQAITQVLTPVFDPAYSEHSYGFRPQRRGHDAVRKAKGYMQEGYRIVVEIDLEKFFDRVHHDRLMARLAERVPDKRVLKLIRSYLQAGVMENGLIRGTAEGAPQGGPLSPLLSNIVLDELDKELEKRNLRLVSYADDCNIYVKTWKAGQRVMDSVSSFIERKLKIEGQPNEKQERKFLGFTFGREKENPRIRIFFATSKGKD